VLTVAQTQVPFSLPPCLMLVQPQCLTAPFCLQVHFSVGYSFQSLDFLAAVFDWWEVWQWGVCPVRWDPACWFACSRTKDARCHFLWSL